jgi:hypothetical protein
VFRIVAALIALSCVAASLHRVRIVLGATALDTQVVLETLRRRPKHEWVPVFASLASGTPVGSFERDLADALRAPRAKRAALVHAALRELDFELGRWLKVPRLCASISTSGCLFVGTMILRAALVSGDVFDTDLTELVTVGLAGRALDVAATGVVGAAACIALHGASLRLKRAEAAGADGLVEALEESALGLELGTGQVAGAPAAEGDSEVEAPEQAMPHGG